MKKIISVLICVMLMSFAAYGAAKISADNTQAETATSKPASDESYADTSANKSQAETASGEAKTKADAEERAAKAIEALEEKYLGLQKDELKWDYDASTKTVTISGKGPMRDYMEEAPEWDRFCEEAEHVVISDKVTSIGAGAFLFFTALTDAEIGQDVEWIGDSAFDFCTSLASVNFPKNLKYIGSYAFNNALLHSEDGFVFPEGMLYLGDSSFHSAFKESYVSIPASLAVIEKGAFGNCFVEEFRVNSKNPCYKSDDGILYDKEMTTLINYPADRVEMVYTIPESVTTIQAEAISVTNQLYQIEIPANVATIEEGSIFWNYALGRIGVDEANKNFRSEDGVLYTADLSRLVSYPPASTGKEYTILKGCKRIDEYALSQANNLEELHIPEGVEEIGYNSVYGCENLTHVELPKSLKRIDPEAFESCHSLGQVDYAGTGADWDKVEIEAKDEYYSEIGWEQFVSKIKFTED